MKLLLHLYENLSKLFQSEIHLFDLYSLPPFRHQQSVIYLKIHYYAEVSQDAINTIVTNDSILVTELFST